MATNRYIQYNRSAKLDVTTHKFLITHAFAEANFSKSALSYGTKTDTHYEYDWGKNVTILVYELPKLFKSPEFHEIMRSMVVYCIEYLKEHELTETKFYNSYMKNKEKEVKSV